MKFFYEAPPQHLIDAFAKLVFDEWGESWDQVCSTDCPSLILGEENGEFCVGGAVFIAKIPEDAAPESWKKHFDKKPYLGYLLVPQEKRGQGYASQWLEYIRQHFPEAWLVCKKNLEPFYARLGFETQASFPGAEGEEVLMALKNT